MFTRNGPHVGYSQCGMAICLWNTGELNTNIGFPCVTLHYPPSVHLVLRRTRPPLALMRFQSDHTDKFCTPIFLLFIHSYYFQTTQPLRPLILPTSFRKHICPLYELYITDLVFKTMHGGRPSHLVPVLRCFAYIFRDVEKNMSIKINRFLFPMIPTLLHRICPLFWHFLRYICRRQ